MIDLDTIEHELIKLQNKAIKKEEVPVSAIIVYKDKIISKKYNTTERKNNFMNHAEILVIKEAMKKLKNWRLDECTLYVSLEPCDMCKEIIKKSRIKNVYYFSNQNEHKTESEPLYKYVENKIMSEKMSNFFKNKR